jgi:hypothetical protein
MGCSLLQPLTEASYTDRRAGRFPTVPRIARKSGDFSELRHSETMICATRRVWWGSHHCGVVPQNRIARPAFWTNGTKAINHRDAFLGGQTT